MMARTKKSENLPQEEQRLPLGSESEMPEIADESTVAGMGAGAAESCGDYETAEDGSVETALDQSSTPDGNDGPLLLPEAEDENDTPHDSDGTQSEANPDDGPSDDWPTEDESPLPDTYAVGSAQNTVDGDCAADNDGPHTAEMEEDVAADTLFGEAIVGAAAKPVKAPTPRKRTPASVQPPTKPRRQTTADVLTIERHAQVETSESKDELIWHEVQNAARTRRILTGTLGGIERLENGKSVAVVYYKDLRIIIPVKEMMLRLGGENAGYGAMAERESKILNNMLGCDIDFVLKGIDSKTRSAVASRREAMLRKRKLFYMDIDTTAGLPRIHEGRVVQARVIAVAAKVVRVEVFGVETSIMARDLSWEWIGDAHERYTVGDRILVRVNKIRAEDIEEFSIQADARSMTENTVAENLKKCRVQGKYAGSVTDIHKGVVFVRLAIGVNAIAHSCLDSRMPAKQDSVSFVVTHIDMEQGVAMGLITRIIKQRI